MDKKYMDNRIVNERVIIERKLLETLKRRYFDCDSLGHRAADKQKEICNYCYRNLNENSEENFRALARKLPLVMGCFDVINYMNQKRQEMENQISRGIDLLKKELELSGELENVLAD